MLQNIFELERRSWDQAWTGSKDSAGRNRYHRASSEVLTGSIVRVTIVEQRENEKTISRRSVLLNDAGRVLISAHSKIFVCNLPGKIARQIRQKQLGIGTIIANSHLETFRKIIEVGYDPVKG